MNAQTHLILRVDSNDGQDSTAMIVGGWFLDQDTGDMCIPFPDKLLWAQFLDADSPIVDKGSEVWGYAHGSTHIRVVYHRS